MRSESLATELSPSRISVVACDTISTVGSDSESSEDWFGTIARGLLGKDAGHALSRISGLPEGSCYKYTTRQPGTRRQPPGYLIRQLLRSEQGYQFLAAIMDGSAAPWWRELQRAQRVAEAIANIG